MTITGMLDVSDIKAGDLVMVVRGYPCCGFWGDLGHQGRIFHVTAFDTVSGQCPHCHDVGTYATAKGDGMRVGYSISRLKRIPPPEELGIVDEREEITGMNTPMSPEEIRFFIEMRAQLQKELLALAHHVIAKDEAYQAFMRKVLKPLTRGDIQS